MTNDHTSDDSDMVIHESTHADTANTPNFLLCLLGFILSQHKQTKGNDE